ncbi:hypothetical protein A2662_04410 [Candidatus Giovannonibacteria bacterium RIFCSPHIGHO2_01_FULL_45_33]|uniref:Uncharacterized protein n=1 Tax=Candidatus Giovannonibacteria bacterium RIFCSPLOWO2_01_FULL_45_34 TaxID=1798351 RepID=A0A1F5X0E1_9BACT|nr:MAG: hypothetical protein A2662_04410 [Candidatus Giovannonibacteria bacterium RIFCSPHIGHO2_01_FULL_45_33]OGF70191.1 MAG: hypothetical protein A3C73_04470 [Candidatus Giovannonibacteria bacterium RIFCSPHIGHO2_02_FULL_44_11]OGF81367.1 MAG: hypothetical protein A2930_00635 [Candidatus Giovannonibacteria bacterium RIFCSPLOWO2_01_FULL_45_34]
MLNKGMKKLVVGIFSKNGLKMRQVLVKAAAEKFGKNFPKMPFKDAHCDIVNCFGVLVSHPEITDALKAANCFFEIVGETIDIRNEVVVMRPEGLVIYETANGIPLKYKFRYAVPAHYAILTPYAMASVSRNQNPGK